MSLDVYLYGPSEEVDCICQCGHKHKKDWRECYFWQNITHNLGGMAKAAGIYHACWRPEEIGAKQAKDIIPLLEAGLKWLRENRAEAEKHNAPNGWGMYENFVPWVERYLEACREFPDAEISVSG